MKRHFDVSFGGRWVETPMNEQTCISRHWKEGYILQKRVPLACLEPAGRRGKKMIITRRPSHTQVSERGRSRFQLCVRVAPFFEIPTLVQHAISTHSSQPSILRLSTWKCWFLYIVTSFSHQCPASPSFDIGIHLWLPFSARQK